VDLERGSFYALPLTSKPTHVYKVSATRYEMSVTPVCMSTLQRPFDLLERGDAVLKKVHECLEGKYGWASKIVVHLYVDWLAYEHLSKL
jgi:hypothetical protein